MRERMGIIVVPVVDDLGIATWTVSRFHRGQLDAYACDRALYRLSRTTSRLYDLAQSIRLSVGTRAKLQWSLEN